MTAEIGVLNKSAAVLAADSAVTISNGELGGRKVYNTANKIFNLSRNHPVGIMIYNNAQICSIPWETLIKLYRKEIKEKSFNSILQYKNSFIQFLQRNLEYFTDDGQNNDTRNLCYKVFDLISNDAYEKIEGSYNNNASNNLSGKEKYKILYQSTIDAINHHLTETNTIPKLKSFKASIAEVRNTYNKSIEKWIKEFEKTIQIKLTRKDKDSFITLIYNFIFKEVFIEDWTGVVFVGFGRKQIYPQLVDVAFGAVICNNFRYRIQGGTIITNKNGASITPFAQRDMIDTFIQGIDPEMNHVLHIILQKTFQQFSEHIAMNFFGVETQKEKNTQLNQISDKVVKYFTNEFKKIREENHINPVLNAVSSLSKEDLAEIAESLINLTYLKRRISFEEKEETVGGPIDVAIITKGDGFIWLKRKHYFQPEKNIQYLANLFKNS